MNAAVAKEEPPQDEAAAPTISVVIPAYNAEATIGEALASVCEQTFASCETIVVDDASTDGTVAAVQELARSTGAIRLVSMSANGGPAAARNRGIAEASGEWIAFLDADDAWLPQRLELGMKIAQENADAAMICSEVVAFSDQPDKRISEKKIVEQSLPLSAFSVRNPVATSTVLVKKSVLDRVGRFDEQFCGPEDYDLWIRVAAVHPVVKAAVPLSRYRQRPGSLSQDERTFLPQVLRVLDKQYGEGGSLSEFGHLRGVALAWQYNHASWMAYCRGTRLTALTLLLKSQWYWIRNAKKAGAEAPDPFAPLFLRYLVGQKPGVRAKGGTASQTLRSRMKRAKYILGNLVTEPRLTIHMQVDNEEHLTEEDEDGWLHHFNLFSQPHRAVPFVKSKELGVAILPVPEEFDAYLGTINGKNSAAYYARKAKKRGYVVKEIERNQYVDDIHELKISKTERQGRPIPDRYFTKREHYAAVPNYRYLGVLTPDGKLVAYAWVPFYNEVAVVDAIMGHADYLNDGIVYLLCVHIVEQASLLMNQGSPVRYVMYDTFFGATPGMRMFKDKLGFKPHRVKWSP